MKAISVAMVATLGVAWLLGYGLAAILPGRTVEATILGFGVGMSYTAFALPPILEAMDRLQARAKEPVGPPGKPPPDVIRDGSLAGCRADTTAPASPTGQLLCWRPRGHSGWHWDDVDERYWSTGT